jgi:hypothetical protein
MSFRVEKESCGTTRYYNRNNELHREDGPAVEWVNPWFLAGILANYPKDIIHGKEWWFNGMKHRTDGPALELINGNKIWFLFGKRHRLDGPACIIVSDLTKFKPNNDSSIEEYLSIEYWVDDIKYTEEQYPQAVLKYKLKQLVG